MKKNKIISALCSILFLSSLAQAQIETKKMDSTSSATVKKTSPINNSSGVNSANIIVPQNRKKVSINFEDELVEGQYDAPEILLMNSRKLIKYKDLFNTRNNFLDEIETNRGMFNGQRKNK